MAEPRDQPGGSARGPVSPGSRTAPRADQATVRRLLHEQAPELADRSLVPGPTGWDNTHWLLGGDLAYPPVDAHEHAEVLGQFLTALHVAAPAGAPHNPYRSVPLADRAARTDAAVKALEDRAGEGAAVGVLREAWMVGLDAPVHDGPPTWVHGDLHPGNQLAHAGTLTAVVDWGDVAAGDPAADLATAWWTLPVSAHGSFRGAYGGIDDPTWCRSMGWAAAIALYLLTEGPAVNDPALVAMGRRTVTRLRAAL